MRKKVLNLALVSVLSLGILTGCDVEYETGGGKVDVQNTIKVADNLQENQPTPTDIDYSLERYNLIRRTYWVNGQREKANSLICEIEKPLGYIILLTDNGSILGRFIVDGKVSSLNSFLTPDSEYYSGEASNVSVMRRDGEESSGSYTSVNKWLADVDGSYGENDNGIFFFTPDGKYLEWTGTYLYSDIPFEVEAPILKVGN